MSTPSFYKQILHENGITLEINEEKITPLQNEFCKYEYINPKITLYEEDEDKEPDPEDIEEIRDLNALKTKYKLCLTPYKKIPRGEKRPRLFHELRKYEEGMDCLKKIPHGAGEKDVYIRIDKKNKRAKYYGFHAWPHGETDWFYIDPKREKKKKEPSSDKYDDGFRFVRDVLRTRGGEELNNEKIQNIPEMIIGKGPMNELICITNSNDEPAIGCFGTRGKGKSVMLHLITDFCKWQQKRCIMVLNDNMRKCGPWMYRNDPTIKAKPDDVGDKEATLHVKDIWQRFGVPLTGLPTVFLHPYIEERGRPPNRLMHETNGFYFTLPYQEYIMNFTRFVNLDNSRRVFNNPKVKQRLLECQSPDEVKELFDELKLDKDLPKNSIDRIEQEIEDLMSKKILDLGGHIPSKWYMRYKDSSLLANPMLVASISGLVPILETDQITGTDYWPKILLYLIDDLLYRQKTHPLFLKNRYRFMLIIDEIGSIFTKEYAKTVCYTELKKLFKEGRNTRIGLAVATQAFQELPDLAQQNITHFITFVNPTEGDAFRQRFGLSIEYAKIITKLKRFEFFAVSSESDGFTVYKTDGTKYTTKGPIQGTVLFPLSKHSAPQDVTE